MNSKFVLVAALAAGALSPAQAQTTSPVPPAAAPANAATALSQPVAVPAKIALIEFLETAAATNEGQKARADVQKKYEPTKNKLDALGAEIESLTKQLQGAPATMSDDEKGSRQRTIETKQKQFQRDGEDAQTAFNSDMQDAIGKIAQKIGPVVIKYVQQNGYTMLLDNTGQPQQGGLAVLWGGTDISQAVIDAYNVSSGVPAPPPSAPSAARPRPASPRPSAPKQ